MKCLIGAWRSGHGGRSRNFLTAGETAYQRLRSDIIFGRPPPGPAAAPRRAAGSHGVGIGTLREIASRLSVPSAPRSPGPARLRGAAASTPASAPRAGRAAGRSSSSALLAESPRRWRRRVGRPGHLLPITNWRWSRNRRLRAAGTSAGLEALRQRLYAGLHRPADRGRRCRRTPTASTGTCDTRQRPRAFAAKLPPTGTPPPQGPRARTGRRKGAARVLEEHIGGRRSTMCSPNGSSRQSSRGAVRETGRTRLLARHRRR